MTPAPDVIRKRIDHRMAALNVNNSELARRMESLGHSWYPGLARKVRLGQRDVLFHEAFDLARVLDTSTAWLAGEEDVDPETEAIDRAIAQLESLRKDMP